MELQQIFNTVSTHLLTQNHKSTAIGFPDYAGMCAYRGNNGASCAIGCLIPAAAYNSSMEGQNLSDAAVWAAVYPVIGSGFIDLYTNNAKFELLWKLQQLHDFGAVCEWPERLQELADDFELTFTPLTERN